jgi:hypothetical protein
MFNPLKEGLVDVDVNVNYWSKESRIEAALLEKKK